MKKNFAILILLVISGIGALLFYNFSCAKISETPDNSAVELKLKVEDPRSLYFGPDSLYKFRINRKINYTKFGVKGISTLRALDTLYGIEGRNVILAINRIDTRNMRMNDTLVIPDTIANVMSFSPFPFYLEDLETIPKLLIVSRKVQAFAAYQNGVLVKWGPTSTGKRSTQTPKGLFSMNWKKRETISTIDEEWILPYYFNFMNFEGVAFHQYSLPGYPASHSCVRLAMNDAIWIYDWADQWIITRDGVRRRAHGTPVIVFDDYQFGKTKPWRKLVDDPEADKVPESVVKNLIGGYLPEINKMVTGRDSVYHLVQIEKAQRDSILAARKDSLMFAKKQK